MENENYNVGGTGAAIFASSGPSSGPSSSRPVNRGDAIGDSYKAPMGVPDWKQPSYDDDDDPHRLPNNARRDQINELGGFASRILSRFSPEPLEQALVLAKAFYFCFFAAFGSLFPLIAVYFKQIGLDAEQAGFLIGVRPIIEFLAIPFWNKIANTLSRSRKLMLFALLAWVLFTLPLGYVRPPVISCKTWNGSHYLLETPDRSRRRFDLGDYAEDIFKREKRSTKERYEYRYLSNYVTGTSPESIDLVVSETTGRPLYTSWVSPAHSNEVFEREGVQKVFFLLLLLVVIGEFFGSPAIALADSAVISLLGQNGQHRYGRQRMLGSLGWGLTMFVMGIVLDHSKLEESVCPMADTRQKNYHVCFLVFAFLMCVASQMAGEMPFKFNTTEGNNAGSVEQQQQRNANVPNTVTTNAGFDNPPKKEPGEKESLRERAARTKVFAQQLRSLPEFTLVFKSFANQRMFVFMLVAFIMGVGMGLIFTFLFWHLQDLGGGPTLFGIASVINHLSEMGAYFYAFRIINKVGHIKVIAAGLLCNALRFLYISRIDWPWLVLPFEFVQGITHAAVWAACCSFISTNADPELRQSTQSFLHGLHHGLGKFCGAFFGGMLIKKKGTVSVFAMYGINCFVWLALFVAVNFAMRDEGKRDDDDDPNAMGEDAMHLAPHGVPSAPAVPRALSSTMMNEESVDQQADESAMNPFLTEAADTSFTTYTATGQQQQQQEQQYYGRGYTQAQSGYSASGLGLQ